MKKIFLFLVCFAAALPLSARVITSRDNTKIMKGSVFTSILWADGTIQVSSPTGGGGAGDTFDSVSLPAQDFVTYGSSNGAVLVSIAGEETYRDISSTKSLAREIEFTDVNNGRAEYSFLTLSRTWDNAAVNIYATFVATGVTSGAAWFEAWVTSAPATTEYKIVESTVTPDSTNNVYIDFPITLTGYSDGTPITINIIRRKADSSEQSIRMKSCEFYYGVDK